MAQLAGSGWNNGEAERVVPVYARRGASGHWLDYQALYLSVRSGERHNDSVPCEGTSYRATARFNGQCGFKKEVCYAGGYTSFHAEPAPKSRTTVPEGRWVGMRFFLAIATVAHT